MKSKAIVEEDLRNLKLERKAINQSKNSEYRNKELLRVRAKIEVLEDILEISNQMRF